MPIYSFASDTTACSGVRLNDIKDKLAQNLIADGFSKVLVEPASGEDEFSIHLLQGGTPLADVVPFFNHPIPISVMKGSRQPKVELAVDVRNWVRFNAPTQEFVVRNRPDYNWHLNRAILNQLWITEDPSRLRDLSRFALLAYTSHLRESITRRFMLDGNSQLVVAALASYFYLGLFTEEERFDETTFGRHCGLIAQVCNMPASRVLEILEDLPVIQSISQLCDVIKTRTDNPALINLNVGTLVTAIANNWNYAGREALAVSLEHIPTWIMIVYASLNEASYRTSAIAKLVQKLDKRQAGDQFTKSVEQLYHIRAAAV